MIGPHGQPTSFFRFKLPLEVWGSPSPYDQFLKDDGQPLFLFVSQLNHRKFRCDISGISPDGSDVKQHCCAVRAFNIRLERCNKEAQDDRTCQMTPHTTVLAKQLERGTL